MKKLYLLFFPFLFFLSACSADYNAPVVYDEEVLAPLVEEVVVEENEANIEAEVSEVVKEVEELPLIKEPDSLIESLEFESTLEKEEIQKTVTEVPQIIPEKTEPEREVLREEAPVEKASVPLSNDNYYTNVDGNTVHSPAFAPSVPAGASAVCKDGTYSFSQNRRGTCSGHGGVARWL